MKVTPRKWLIERAVFRREEKGDPALPVPLDAPEQLVMLALLSLAEPDGEIPDVRAPSLAELVAMVGLGRSTVARVLNRLEAGGWLVRIRPSVADAIANHERTRYLLCRPVGSGTVAIDSASAETCPGVGQGVVPERDRFRSGTSPAADPSQSQSGTPASPAAGHIPLPDVRDLGDKGTAHTRDPELCPAEDATAQPELPLGPLGAVSSPPARRNSKAAPKGDGSSGVTAASSGADISDIKPEKARKERKPPTRHGVTVKAILDRWWPTQNPAPVNYHQVRKAVEMCLNAGWTEDKLPQALDDVVASRWSITPTTLEKALNDRHKPAAMPSRTSTGYQPYRDPEDDSVYFHPMYESQEASGQ